MENPALGSGPLNVSKSEICRLCMKTHEYYLNVFVSYEELKTSISKAIEDLLVLKVAKDDNLPKMVCCPCVTKLMEFREFKEMCVNSAREFGRHAPVRQITCPVKDEFLPMHLLGEATSGTRGNCVDGESLVPVAPNDLSMDPFAFENQSDTKEEYPRDPLGESDGCGEEDFAETEYNEVASVCSESKPILMDDQGKVKEEVAEVVDNVESHMGEIIDEGVSSDRGGPILLSDILAVMGMVDHCNNIGELTGELEKESDELGADRQGISQNQARDNYSCDPVHEKNLQLEYSLANSLVVDSFTEKTEKKQKKNIKFNASSNKFSQLNDRASFIRDHECEELSHRVEITSYPSEYICNYCSTRYSEKNSLALHIIRHVNGKRLASVLPKKDFLPRIYQNLLVKDRGNAEPVILETSNISFTRKSSRRKNPSYPTEYLCNYCNSRFSEKKSLALHIQRHADGMMSARILPKDFPPRLSQNLLLKDQGNFESVIVEPFNISVTQKISRRKNEKPAFEDPSGGENLGRELRNTSKLFLKSVMPREKALVKAIKCNECGKIFNTKRNLRVHSRIHSGVKPYKCNECEKTFTTSGELKKHSVVHTGVKRFKCNECGKTFSTSGNFRRHSRIHSGVKPFKCNKCERAFNTSCNLNRHSVVHTGVKRLKCNECGKMFSTSSNLRAHSLIHSGVKPFKCNECEKTFTTSGDLKRHSVVHTGVKRFKCNECGKMFTQKNTLKTHSLVHTGLKPFKCNECGKLFYTRSAISRHSVVHTGVKRYKCNECGKMFSESSSFRRHSRIHSGVNPL